MNRLFKKLMSVFAVLVLCLGLVGCNNSAGQGESKSNTGNGTALGESVQYPVTIKDSFDKEVTLEEEPVKVVSVAPNITEMIYKLKAEDKLVARTDYCDYPEEVKNIESIGTLTTPDIEKIISLEPDLVIASTHFNEENAKKLEDAGIKVIALYEENDVKGVYNIINTLGTALNRKSEALQTVDAMEDTINNVETKIKGLEEPTVYYVVGYGEGGDYSAPPNTFVGQLIKLAGGNNIVPESKSWSYSKEALIEADPDIIVVRNGEKEAFKNTDGYKDLTAVKEDHVYEIDNNLLDRQGYRNADGVLELAKIFHPEAFK